MRNSPFHIGIALILYSLVQAVSGQIAQPEYIPSKSSVEAIARSKGDSVMIRWAPDDPLLWELANKYGYRVVRTKVAENNEFLFGDRRISIVVADTIMPYPLDKIEPLAEIDQYSAIAAQAIYGEDFEVDASFEKNPSDVLNKSRELEDRFSFALFSADQSALAAKVHGLWFTDRRVEENSTYLYKVFPLIPAGVINFDTAYVVIATNDTAALPRPFDLSANFGDRYVELTWNREYLQRFYTSYIIERSDDEGLSYLRTNESPFLNIREDDNEGDYVYKVDSLPENNKLYLFRIRGVTPFGETGPPSESVAGRGINNSDFLNPIITKNEVINGSFAFLEWQVPENTLDEISAFEIERSVSSDGPFYSLTPEYIDKNITNFTDTNPLKSGFYRVAAIDKYKEKHYSFPAMLLLPDSIPPQTPTGFSGNIDSTGIVKFSWHSGNDDDLAGYRIYRSNYSKDGYLKINNELIRTTTFTDTVSLRTLTRKVFYKLAAIDNHYNESELTTAIILNRPDTIPPAPPLIINYSVSEKGIMITWTKSPSEDVQSHFMLRRKDGDSGWEPLITDITPGIYIDTTVTNSVVYEYKLVAVDSSGLESKPINPVRIRASGNIVKKQPVEIKGTVDVNGKFIHISWNGTGVSANSKIALYRSVNNEPPVLYCMLSGTEKSYDDRNVIIGNLYTYRLQEISTDGSRSVLGSGITIRF